MRHIAIRLLGAFEVTVDGAPAPSFEYAKVRALLAYLAVEAQHPHSRAALAALLWPDQPERNARGSLSQALTTLRNALGDKHAAVPALLADAQHVEINPGSSIDVDVMRFLALLRESESHTHRSWRTCAACYERLRQALELYNGNFLADVVVTDSDLFEEWAVVQRELFRQRALSTLERLIERAQWCGAYTEALSYARQLIALDPLLEAGQRTFLRLLALNGETAAALSHYRQLRVLLDQELAVEPEEDTIDLVEQIRRGEVTDRSPPYVAPVSPAALVGRGEEARAICAYMRENQGRVLTITGAGGIGKTCLALEVAHELRFDFEDGVYVIELAALSDGVLAASAVARALGVKERSQQPIHETLREALRTKHLLLVLDNFEQIVDTAPLVAGLLAACPALYVLVTSRAPLLIRAERQFALEPLSDADAVQLFLQRAREAGASLAADAASIDVYTAVCRKLDRLPLAIELIAVRARSLTPQELLRQLEQPLQALERGLRDVSERHRSLRHAIRWSYDLLNPEEQAVFRSLGVFVGGCMIEAAQTVIGSTIAVLPVLEALNRASLLQRQIVADQTRFLMLETIREFALEQLEQHHEAIIAGRRHADYVAHFSMTAYVELLRVDAPRWRAWVDAEQDNLRAAFRRALEYRQYETALRSATGVWRFHHMVGSIREGLDRLEAALAYREQVPLELQCNALRAAGVLSIGMNDYARARQWLEAALETAWRIGDQNALQPILTNLGYALLEQGELEDARVHLEVSISLSQRAEDPGVAKFPLGFLASLHLRLGDYTQAQAFSEECLRINQARQDPEGTADAHYTLATIMLAQGHVLRAHQLCETALALHRALSHQFGMGRDIALLGDIAQAQGNDIGALAQYQECLRLWRGRENMATSATVFDSIAGVLNRLGDSVRGATLSSAAAAMRIRAGVRLTAAEQARCDATILACRTALGESAWETAWSTGRALTLGQAVELALELREY